MVTINLVCVNYCVCVSEIKASLTMMAPCSMYCPMFCDREWRIRNDCTKTEFHIYLFNTDTRFKYKT